MLLLFIIVSASFQFHCGPSRFVGFLVIDFAEREFVRAHNNVQEFLILLWFHMLI